MRTSHSTPDVALTARPTADLESDLLIIPVFEDDDFGDEGTLDAASAGEVGRARARGELKGKPFDVFVTSVAPAWKTPRVALVGAGKRRELTTERLRRVAIVGGLAARQRHLTRIALTHRDSSGISAEQAAQALTEGVLLANYDGGSYKTEDAQDAWIERVELRIPGGRNLEGLIERGRVLGEYTNRARVLANEPGNTLPPRRFAHQAEQIAGEAGAGVQVLDDKQIAGLNMGLLLGVAQGSPEPPRLVVLRHEPKEALPGVVLGLVGKGITFDTGGISIKPAENMDRMKDDMSGGAAVICALAAIARLKVPVRCIGLVPMTENMPGGRAVKPGDVLKSAAGKTVEVINTDAEGRLILGDALWYARELGATHLVDLATLTGACVVALGTSTSGLFGTPDAWVEQVRRAGDRAGERSWAMPIFDDYKEQLKSEIADFTNTGGRAAGAITAALFLKEFVGDCPWTHVDIAGTAWAEDAKSYQPKGATGVGVRTLVELALDAGAWSKLDRRAHV